MFVDINGDQYGNIADFATPGAFKDDSVQVNIGVLPFDGAITPLLDFNVDLLVEVADSSGTYFCPRQGFGDIFDTTNRNPGQIHLDQRFLN